MEIITRTVYGAALQTAQLTGKPFNLETNTTLNEKMGVLTNATLAPEEYPRLQYVCIGNGGHGIRNGGSSMAVPVPLQHRTSDAAPYNILPFALRHMDDDMSAGERSRYALRRIEQHSGENYFAYYLRRLPVSASNVVMNHKTVVGANTTVTPFIPTSANLSPVPPDINNQGTTVATGDYLTATLQVDFNLDAFDIEQILAACTIIYGDDDFAIISEIGLCSGLERVISTSGTGNSTINFDEVAAAQIHTHISSFHALKFTMGGINTTFDIGATEPLLITP